MTPERSERTPRYLFDAPAPRLEIVETMVVPSALVEVEPTMAFDDPNPLGLAIFHRDGACPTPADCRPRLEARCHRCQRKLVLCTATAPEVRALKRGGWTCGCGGDDV